MAASLPVVVANPRQGTRISTGPATNGTRACPRSGVRIGQGDAMQEAQVDPARIERQRQDAVRCHVVRCPADRERVVIVVGENGRTWNSHLESIERRMRQRCDLRRVGGDDGGFQPRAASGADGAGAPSRCPAGPGSRALGTSAPVHTSQAAAGSCQTGHAHDPISHKSAPPAATFASNLLRGMKCWDAGLKTHPSIGAQTPSSACDASEANRPFDLFGRAPRPIQQPF